MYHRSAFCARCLCVRAARLEQVGATGAVVRSSERYLLSENRGGASGVDRGRAGAPRFVPGLVQIEHAWHLP